MRRSLRSLRRRPGALIALAVAGAIAFGAAELLPSGEEFTGTPAVVDADTLHLDGQRMRLAGVDAPEARQSCERDGAAWACGDAATAALRDFLGGRTLRCAGAERDRYGRILAQCRSGGEDVGAWLVRQGWAVAYTEYSWRYLPEEWLARWEGRGLWSSRFERPEAWRRRQRG